MHTLNLIDPVKSTIRFESMTFPDGQPHIKIDIANLRDIYKADPVVLISRASNPSDLLLILFTKNALDHLGFERVELQISYLMGARMDRVMNEGEPFSLKSVAEIINQAGFHKVMVFDPHSEVSTAVLNRSYAITNHLFVKDSLKAYFDRHGNEPHCLVSPDAGALKKFHKLASFLHIENLVECFKERDIRTGSLTGFKTATSDLSGLTCFIVDDICDGGGTFSGTAKMLREKSAEKVVLIVSHGIFSKGSEIDYIDEVFTTNSYANIDRVNCVDVCKYLVTG